MSRLPEAASLDATGSGTGGGDPRQCTSKRRKKSRSGSLPLDFVESAAGVSGVRFGGVRQGHERLRGEGLHRLADIDIPFDRAFDVRTQGLQVGTGLAARPSQVGDPAVARHDALDVSRPASSIRMAGSGPRDWRSGVVKPRPAPATDTTSLSIVQEWAFRSALCGPSPLRALQAPREGRRPGVRSPAHARGAPDGVHGAQCHQRRPGAQRARTPRMGPPPVPRTTCPGTPVAPLLVAGHCRLQQGGGGAPGRRPHSRCPGPSRAWIVMTRLAVVGLGGAPRAWAGERGRRHRPGAQSLGAGLARTDGFRSKPRATCPRAQAGMRAPANGRKGPTADSNSCAIEREVV